MEGLQPTSIIDLFAMTQMFAWDEPRGRPMYHPPSFRVIQKVQTYHIRRLHRYEASQMEAADFLKKNVIILFL